MRAMVILLGVVTRSSCENASQQGNKQAAQLHEQCKLILPAHKPLLRVPKNTPTTMIELEVYAAGVRNLEKILELDHELETIPGLHYKVDSNHDIVYMEFDSPTFTLTELKSIFTKLGLSAKIVGTIPQELNPKKSKTQPITLPA